MKNMFGRGLGWEVHVERFGSSEVVWEVRKRFGRGFVEVWDRQNDFR